MGSSLEPAAEIDVRYGNARLDLSSLRPEGGSILASIRLTDASGPQGWATGVADLEAAILNANGNVGVEVSDDITTVTVRCRRRPKSSVAGDMSYLAGVVKRALADLHHKLANGGSRRNLPMGYNHRPRLRR